VRAAPFFPGQEMSTTFAMSVDDTSLYFDVAKLTPKQKKEDEESRDLMGFLQVVLIGLGKPADHVAMYDAFGRAPWPERLATYTDFFRRMGLDPIPPEHRHLHPKEDFYPSVARNLPPTDSVTLYMTSGTNSVLHNDSEALRISRNVNSKFHFAANAPGFGIPVPETLVTTKGGLDSAQVRHFMAKHGPKVMLKIAGLAGARNVTVIDGLDAARAYLSEFDDGVGVLLQQRLDFRRWTEMTADFRITDRDIRIANVRQIMFADGVWVGNRIGPDVVLTEAHRQVLLKVAEYARAQGFVRPEGLNCGVDYFIDGDEVMVTEINARWTGGLFPTEMLRRIGATHENAIAFVDMVRADKFDRYLRFIDEHLYKETKGPFALVPLGCSPIPQMVGGAENFLTWQVVTGDFDAFKQARRDQLGDGALMRADSISLELG
jgi:glutathione synthase/RimK-type ligase-like ATP-grasp enzyme